MMATLKNFLQRFQEVILTILILMVVGDIVFLKTQSDLVLFGVLGIYIGCILFYRLKSAATFRFGLFVLGLMSLAFIVSGTSVITERAAVWLFFLLLTGILQQIKE